MKYQISSKIDNNDLSCKENYKPTEDMLKIIISAVIDVGMMGTITDFLYSTTLAYLVPTKESIHVIKTANELAGYTNAINADWNPQSYYFVHPCDKKVLIPQEYFKSYLIREMAAEIIDYIGEKMSLKEIHVALVCTKEIKGELTIPIKEIVAGAHMNCKVYQSYAINLSNREKTDSSLTKSKKYHWIDSFPDIKSAVVGNTGSLETISECSSNFTVGLSAQEIKAVFGKEKSMKFYVNYISAEK